MVGLPFTRGIVRSGGERGFALLLVLWTLALLALLGSTITASGRAETRVAAHLLASAEAQSAADGAVAVARFHLLDGSPGRWAADGMVHRLTVGASRISVTLRDEAGKIDPNNTPPALLAALLRQQGVDGATAGRVAGAVADWRSAGDAGLGGEYRAEGRAYAPPHEAFESVDELGLVAYVTPRLLELLRPHVSLFIEQTPQPALADPLVAAAMDDAVRRDRVLMNPVDPGAGPSIVLITATAQSGGARYTRRALVRLGGDETAAPVMMLEWDGG